jgi:S1-C subfamily serine protease
MKSLLFAIVATCLLVVPAPAQEGGGFLEQSPTAFCKVKSYEKPLSGDEQYAGSGVFLTHRLVLSCQHNVRTNRPERGDRLTIEFPDGREYGDVAVLRQDPNVDLSLLRVNDPRLPRHETCVVSSRVRQPEKIWSIGYHPGEGRIVEREGTTGDYPHLGWGGQPHLFQHRTHVVQGMSGGPTLDERGQVVGVVVGTTYELDELSQSVMLERVQEFLD